ncbi:MAG: VWA domain-containing protein [Saprospiraceae bacterium]|nr:VWA domain-containing protein [Saprospiraceae bacterium]
MVFASPVWLLLLLPLLLPALRNRAAGRITLRMPQDDQGLPVQTWQSFMRKHLGKLRWVALALLVLAMARPQRRWQEEKVKADALDIILSLDISPSMLSRDFEPDRLSVAKRVAIDFVEKRPHDRLGLVAFSAEAFTQCPLTTDKQVVQGFIRELTVGRLEDGTAIGMGLATAVNRLKDSASKSKIVILVTDGENNAGYITPEQAADIAKTLGIRVYTVGIGSEGYVMSPMQRNPDGSYLFAPRQMVFDTELLVQMAYKTGGRFYRAYSERDLEGIYEEIDRLEKTKIEVSTVQRTKDYYGWFLSIAVALLLVELLGRWVIWRSVTVG